MDGIGTSAYAVNDRLLSKQMTSKEQSAIDEVVKANNAQVGIDGRQMKQSMDKNDFLTLLVTQLQNQDPTAPMEDKEFIAQMAQFSTLEQMNNLGTEFGKLSGLLSAGQAYNVLGKDVDIAVGDNIISGTVDEVTSGEYPQVFVNGSYFDYNDVIRVKKD